MLKVICLLLASGLVTCNAAQSQPALAEGRPGDNVLPPSNNAASSSQLNAQTEINAQAKVHIDKGVSLLHAGKWPSALKEFDQAGIADSESIEPYIKAAELLEQTNDPCCATWHCAI